MKFFERKRQFWRECFREVFEQYRELKATMGHCGSALSSVGGGAAKNKQHTAPSAVDFVADFELSASKVLNAQERDELWRYIHESHNNYLDPVVQSKMGSYFRRVGMHPIARYFLSTCTR